MDFESKKLSFFRNGEEMLSMFLGLAIVLVVFFLITSYLTKRKAGNIDVPGVSTTAEITGTLPGNIAVGKMDLVKAVAKPTQPLTQTPLGIPVDGPVVGSISVTNYIVISGDSLWKIALSKLGSGYRWVELAKLNKLTDAGRLEVGQVLLLPDNKEKILVSSSKILKTIEGNEYVVEKGDSLSKIALMAYGDSFAWTKIWEANKQLIRNPSVIHKGWKLTIPRW